MTNCPHCGCDLEPPKPSKPRSVPQHRRYFAMIRHAFAHWPGDHDFTPSSETHLRRWLQAKAGYHLCKTVDTEGMTPEHAVAAISAAMREAGEHPFVKSAGAKLYVFHSPSIDFDTLPHLKACALFDAVAEVIAAETGRKMSEVLPPMSEPKPRQRDALREASI